MGHALCLLEADSESDNDPFKFECDKETGSVVFKTKKVSVLNSNYFRHAEEIPYSIFPKLRRFLQFFGPNELQFKEYLY